MTKSPHELFDLAGRIFGMGVLIATRPDVYEDETYCYYDQRLSHRPLSGHHHV